MRALIVERPGVVTIAEVAAPVPAEDELVVSVERAGICGTDVEFVRGTQPYLHDGGASFPLRIGHEWCGIVERVGSSVEHDWIGMRVTADTMLGCGQCSTCAEGRQHLCPDRTEIGVLGGRPGALADEIAVPVRAVRALPLGMTATAGALIEPGSLAYRCVATANVPPGGTLAVLGAGAIGLLCVALAADMGSATSVVARSERRADLASQLGARGFYHEAHVDDLAGEFDAVISVSPDPRYPALAQSLVKPGGTIILAGVSGEDSPLETRHLVIRDITTHSLLSGSPVFDASISALHRLGSRIDKLVAAPLTLDDLAANLSKGSFEDTAPKVHALLERAAH